MAKIMRRIIFVIMALALVAPVSLNARKKQNADISFKEVTYDFGTVPERGGKVSHTFEFVNTGNANLVIKDVTAECGCTTPEYPQNPIAPGKKGVVKVTYNPLGRPGGFSKTVTVKTNGKTKRVYLKIKGVVNPNKKK